MLKNISRLNLITHIFLLGLFLIVQILQPLTISLEERLNASVSKDYYLDWDKDGLVEVATEEELADPVSSSLTVEKFIHNSITLTPYHNLKSEVLDRYQFQFLKVYQDIFQPPKI